MEKEYCTITVTLIFFRILRATLYQPTYYSTTPVIAYFLFNGQLLILQGLHLYWGYLIFKILRRFIFLKVSSSVSAERCVEYQPYANTSNRGYLEFLIVFLNFHVSIFDRHLLSINMFKCAFYLSFMFKVIDQNIKTSGTVFFFFSCIWCFVLIVNEKWTVTKTGAQRWHWTLEIPVFKVKVIFFSQDYVKTFKKKKKRGEVSGEIF